MADFLSAGSALLLAVGHRQMHFRVRRESAFSGASPRDCRRVLRFSVVDMSTRWLLFPFRT
jgi:hypothetical protein